LKSQLSSTKLQINLKSQYSMIKHAALNELYYKPSPWMKMILGRPNDYSIVWIFEFGVWNLFVIWFLMLGIFMI